MRFREPPSSWYDPPDEPSDAEEEACREAWDEYVDDYCETCSWKTTDDSDVATCSTEQPCDDCAQHAPQTYDRWCSDYHDEQRRRSYD